MAETLPIACSCKTAAGTTITNYLKVIHDFIVANGGLVWSITNLVGGSTPSSFTIVHSTGFQINLRTSGSTCLGMVAKTGGITDSATPGAPANSLTESVFFNNTSAGARVNIALYAQSMLFLIQNTAFTFFQQGFLAGKGRAIRGTNRFYQLCGAPDLTASAATATWLTTGSTATIAARPSSVEFGNVDAAAVLVNGASSSRATLNNSNVDRIAPAIIGAGARTATLVVSMFPVLIIDELGFDMKSKASPLVLLPSAGSNQAWMYVGNSVTTFDGVVAWNKTVDPTIPT